MSNPLPLSILDVAAFAAALPAKIDKDVRRASLFAVASANRAREILETEPLRLPAYVAAEAELLGEWVDAALKASPSRWSFASLFNRDPFRGVRDKTRAFARVWGLDPYLIEELG